MIMKYQQIFNKKTCASGVHYLISAAAADTNVAADVMQTIVSGIRTAARRTTASGKANLPSSGVVEALSCRSADT